MTRICGNCTRFKGGFCTFCREAREVGCVEGYEAAVRDFWRAVCLRHVAEEAERAKQLFEGARQMQSHAATSWGNAHWPGWGPVDSARYAQQAAHDYAGARSLYRRATEAEHAAKMLPTWAAEGA